MERESNITRPLAPEDVRPGHFVSVLHIVDEHLPCPCFGDAAWRDTRPLRTLWLPWGDGGLPMKVVELCLPFVLVERPGGRHRTLDLRRYRLARVSRRYAEEVFKRIKADKQKRKADDADDDKDDKDDDE